MKEKKLIELSGMEIASIIPSSKTPTRSHHRRKCGGSLGGSLCGSLSGSMGGGLATTAGGNVGGTHGGSVPRLTSGSRSEARELEGLRSALHDRETVIQNLRAQLGLNSNSRSQTHMSSSANSTSGAPLVSTGQNTTSATVLPPLSDSERPLAEQRLARLRADADSKRAAIRGLKGALQRLDITDNIDVRIRQAELEYALGREELDLLSISEELRTLQGRLEQTHGPPEQRRTIYSWLRAGAHLSLLAVQVSCDPTRPRWGASTGPSNAAGLYVDWAADGEPLHRGDRLLEVNGKLLTSRSREELSRLLAVSYDPAEIVVLRHRTGSSQNGEGHRHHRTSNSQHGTSALRADNLRLTHRISYLEEQVRELQAKEQQHVTSISITSPPASPPAPALSSNLTSANGLDSQSTLGGTGSEAVEVFRRGSKVTTLLHGKVVRPHVQQSQWAGTNGLSNGQQHVTTTIITKPEDVKNNPSFLNHQPNNQNNASQQDAVINHRGVVTNNHIYHQPRIMNGYHHHETHEEKWRRNLDRSINNGSVNMSNGLVNNQSMANGSLNNGLTNGETMRSESRASVHSNNSRNGPLTNKDLQNMSRNGNEYSYKKEIIEDSLRRNRQMNSPAETDDTNNKINEGTDKKIDDQTYGHPKLGGSITNIQQACANDRKEGFVNDLIRNIDLVNDMCNNEKSLNKTQNSLENHQRSLDSSSVANDGKSTHDHKKAKESSEMLNDNSRSDGGSHNKSISGSEEGIRIAPDFVPAVGINGKNLGNVNESEHIRMTCSLGADMQYDGSRPPTQRIPPDRPERPERPEARRRSRKHLPLTTESADEATLYRVRTHTSHSGHSNHIAGGATPSTRRHHYHRANSSSAGEIIIDNILVDQIEKIRDEDDRSSIDGASVGGGRQWDERSSKSLEFERCSGNGLRPTPPKKPLRLSLHRARSLQTVTPGIALIEQTHQNGAELYSKVDSKRPSKRTHTHAHSIARRLQQQV